MPDENVDSLEMLLRAKADLAMDVVNLKISKLGGLTKFTKARDLGVSMGIALTLEDNWGGDITTAAIALLSPATCGGCGWVEWSISFLAAGNRLRHGRP